MISNSVVIMTMLDILAKNQPDKHKSRLQCLNSDRTPKKPQDTHRLLCCLPGGSQQLGGRGLGSYAINNKTMFYFK